MSGHGPIPDRHPKTAPSRVSFVVEELRTQIVEGTLPPGTRLDQRTVAGELGVSVIPVREALQVLQSQGLVTNYPNRGSFVTTLSARELAEMFFVRELLDPAATEAGVERISAAELARLADVVDEMVTSMERNDHELLFDLNREFHFTIYEASGMPILVDLIAGIRNRYAVYSRLVIEFPEYAIQSLQDHREILAACLDRDAQRASTLMRNHLEAAARYLTDHMRSLETAPAPDARRGEGR
jgi:DNA-binding GntR family transcriptional regulator